MENYNKSMSANTNRQLSKEEYRKLCNETLQLRTSVAVALQTKVSINDIGVNKQKYKRVNIHNFKNNVSIHNYRVLIFNAKCSYINQDGYLTSKLLQDILDVLNVKNNGYSLVKFSDKDWKWYKDENLPYIEFKDFTGTNKK